MPQSNRFAARAGWIALAISCFACKASAPARDAGMSVRAQDASSVADAGGMAGTNVMMRAAALDASSPGLDASAHRDGGQASKIDAAPSPRADAGVGSCENGFLDGMETDIDCGGKECGTCLSGRHCLAGSDCASGSCDHGSCTCLALSACPRDACGTIHNCGSELACGDCASGVCYENRCCTPRACAQGDCGVYADGCGGTIRCGDASCCTPRTCDHPSLANRCGAFDDQCGGSVSCSCVDKAARCYLGACCVPNACDGDACGTTLSDGCGGVTSCSCATGRTCYEGHCCAPLDCSGFQGPGCKSMDDGCGGSVTCGCADGQSCNEDGSCCTKLACGGAIGDVCGAASSDGCGGTQNCVCGGSGLSCYGGRCCQAQSCTQQGLDERCGPATDGCGVQNLWCGCGSSNAIRVERRAACGHACADTLAKVDACETTPALEVLDQTAGWDFNASLSSSACNASFGFSPNWNSCSASGGFSIDARGFIFLNPGTHCFAITGSKTNSCGALYFVSTPQSFNGWENLSSATAATVVSKQSVACFDLTAADYYPIRWHYTQDGTLESFHVEYCQGSANACVPLSSAMLYPALD